MTATRSPYTNAALAALAPAVWGSTYLVTTELLPAGRPLLAALLRALPAGLVLLALTRRLPRGRWWGRALVLGTLNIGAFFYFLFVAAYHLPGGVAALVMASQPTLVLLLSVPLLGDRVRLPQVVACVLGVSGVALLALKGTAALDAVGLAAAVGGALCMALGIVLTKRWGRPEGVSLLGFTGWQLTAGGLVLLPMTLGLEGLPAHLSGRNLLGYAYLGIVGALVAYAIWFRGIERLPAIAVSFLAFASPLVATVLGWAILGEGLTFLQLLGAVVIVGAVALAQLNPGRLSLPTPRSKARTSESANPAATAAANGPANEPAMQARQ